MAGKALTFFNSDDTPHQITVAGGPSTEVFLRGQTAALTIDTPGEYNSICGLHPSMMGVIEDKKIQFGVWSAIRELQT
jgi:plastocyanin